MDTKPSLFYNANLVMPDHALYGAALEIAAGKIIAVLDGDAARQRLDVFRSNGEKTQDCQGDWLIPGLIDFHVHGCGGADTMDANAEAWAQMSSCLLEMGTAAFLATTMTLPPERLQQVFALGKSWPARLGQAEFLGFHMEGPCIAAEYRGAQGSDAVCGNIEDWPRSQLIRLITLAPELEQSQPLIEWAREQGVRLSVGHSGASYDEMCEMVNRLDIRQVTHAFNAMPPIHHRKPGLLTAALLDERVSLELIADGIHVHPAVIELTIRLKTAEKVILVSDGTRATGLPEGQYELGGQTIHLHAGRLTLANGTLAGSAKPLLDGVRLVCQTLQRPIHQAVRMASFNPAQALGLEHRLGSLLPDREATFFRLSPQLEIRQSWQKGSQIQKNEVE